MSIPLIFKVTTNGTFASIFYFDLAVSNGSGAKTNTTGAFSFGGLAEGNDGNFYGTASSGGKYGYGTAFKVTTNGVLTTLVDFNNINGASPEASLLLASDGSFYGTTYIGGLNGAGTVYNLTTNGIITTLYAFSPAVWSGSAYTNAHGNYPESVLTFGADGNLYGTTMYGGTGGSGTVFQVDTPHRAEDPVARRQRCFELGQSGIQLGIRPGGCRFLQHHCWSSESLYQRHQREPQVFPAGWELN